MFHVVGRALTTRLQRVFFVKQTVFTQQLSCGFVRGLTNGRDEEQPPFDPHLLRVLVCPLSKKALRYNSETSELINDELGIAYPVIDGIPNMIPQDARLVQKDQEADVPQQ
ncbi:protein preY, mitochondrial isoform X1 [Cynoglossus semilaevis]|uniref:Protein preY, mitochondrial n=1 Tax=Cynoglossus semilaevis TaxID=244447 RepID=A0A3P8X5Q5_CYNSE|nr:protein preY, mitochondrial isoform X1 [Cynoglossus semilaevis]